MSTCDQEGFTALRVFFFFIYIYTIFFLPGSRTGEIRFWNSHGDHLGKKLVDTGGKICSICASSNSPGLTENILATGSDRSHIKIWTPHQSNNARTVLRGHGDQVTHLQVVLVASWYTIVGVVCQARS